jgi:hypothetical protein
MGLTPDESGMEIGKRDHVIWQVGINFRQNQIEVKKPFR